MDFFPLSLVLSVGGIYPPSPGPLVDWTDEGHGWLLDGLNLGALKVTYFSFGFRPRPCPSSG